jgi:hypothetical protein
MKLQTAVSSLSTTLGVNFSLTLFFSAYLGTTTLANLCTQLQANSQAGNMRNVENVKQLEAAYEQIQTALKQAF